jgi:hypothetical protein
MKRKHLLKSATLVLSGLAFWLLVGPYIIGLGGESGSFVSFMSWLGFSFSMLGIVLFFYGVRVLI